MFTENGFHPHYIVLKTRLQESFEKAGKRLDNEEGLCYNDFTKKVLLKMDTPPAAEGVFMRRIKGEENESHL